MKINKLSLRNSEKGAKTVGSKERSNFLRLPVLHGGTLRHLQLFPRGRRRAREEPSPSSEKIRTQSNSRNSAFY